MSNKPEKYPKEFLEYIKLIKNKRARIVIDHIIKYGSITTEDLEATYKYKHAPRAARDVRDIGVPLITSKSKSADGKSIATYKFGDLSKLQTNRIAGRIVFPKHFKAKLYDIGEGKCFVCNGKFEERYLQIDHKIPYEVGGDLSIKDRVITDFMLLCGSCNRAKSWSCEHCANWHDDKDPKVCLKCYWGNPQDYTHIALNNIRRLDIQWEGKDVEYYEQLKKIANENKIDLPDLVKKIIREKTSKP